jgi:hypothetical protein
MSEDSFERFERIGGKKVMSIMASLSSYDHMLNRGPSHYRWSKSQAEAVIVTLKNKVKEIEKSLGLEPDPAVCQEERVIDEFESSVAWAHDMITIGTATSIKEGMKILSNALQKQRGKTNGE